MKVFFFDTHQFEKKTFEALNRKHSHELVFVDTHLNATTASLVTEGAAICCFVNDKIDAEVIKVLQSKKVKLIALRSAGFNNVDLAAAGKNGIHVVRVPAYSPYSVAEHTVALILALNRKIVKASARVRDLNFSLDGLEGFDLHGKTVGIIGAGKIGSVLVQIMNGFGCKVLIHDGFNPNVKSVPLDELFMTSDIVSMHVPLSKSTHHLINAAAFSKMKKGVMFVNTSRGGLVDTKALIDSLKSGQVGSAALDVYEEEENLYFEDHSQSVLQDDVLARLMTFPNVLITAHQAFFTNEALHNIAETTLQNITDYSNGKLANEVKA